VLSAREIFLPVGMDRRIWRNCRIVSFPISAIKHLYAASAKEAFH